MADKKPKDMTDEEWADWKQQKAEETVARKQERNREARRERESHSRKRGHPSGPHLGGKDDSEDNSK